MRDSVLEVVEVDVLASRDLAAGTSLWPPRPSGARWRRNRQPREPVRPSP